MIVCLPRKGSEHVFWLYRKAVCLFHCVPVHKLPARLNAGAIGPVSGVAKLNKQHIMSTDNIRKTLESGVSLFTGFLGSGSF